MARAGHGRGGVSDAWRLDHPWAAVYSFGMARPALARTVGVLAFGTGLQGLYDAIDAIGEVPAGGRVLDVPCGAGIALDGVPPGSGISYVAADISATMLRRAGRAAARRGVATTLIQTDVGALPLADRSVDLCLSLTGLHCFPDPRAAVAELARVSRDRIELTWLRSDAGLRYRPVILAGRLGGLVGPSATLDQVSGWLGDAGFEVEGRVEGSFAYAGARRASRSSRPAPGAPAPSRP